MIDRVGHAGVSTGSTWVTNTTLESVADRMKSAGSMVLLTHSKPDGDAIGSTLALARSMQQLGIDATPVYAPPWFNRHDALLRTTNVIHLEHGTLHRAPFDRAELAVIVDTGSWSQLADYRSWLEGRSDRTIIIDHHAHGDAEIATTRYIDTGVAAVCEPVANLCCLLLDLDGARGLPPEIAEPLYLGIATDTGWFRYSNVKADTMRLAGDLIDTGIDANAIYQLIEQSDEPARLRLMARALNSLTLHDNNRIAVMSISQQDLHECGGDLEHVGGLTDLPQSVAVVRVVALLTEVERGLCKVSFRSKSGPGARNVNHVSQRFGGGGHANAAGAKIKATLADARRQVVEALMAERE